MHIHIELCGNSGIASTLHINQEWHNLVNNKKKNSRAYLFVLMFQSKFTIEHKIENLPPKYNNIVSDWQLNMAGHNMVLVVTWKIHTNSTT